MTYKVQIDDTIRDATPEEAAAIDAQHAETQARADALDARNAALQSAQTKLAALGLTADEIAALLGR
jgi:DNA-directed RNA polymerase specialized sigma24 family protein